MIFSITDKKLKMYIEQFKTNKYQAFSKQQRNLGYFLTFLLVAVQGFPFFFEDRVLLIYTIIVTIAFLRKRPKLDMLFIYVIVIFAAILLLQGLISREFSIKLFLGTIARI